MHGTIAHISSSSEGMQLLKGMGSKQAVQEVGFNFQISPIYLNFYSSHFPLEFLSFALFWLQGKGDFEQRSGRQEKYLLLWILKCHSTSIHKSSACDANKNRQHFNCTTVVVILTFLIIPCGHPFNRAILQIVLKTFLFA